MDLPNQDGPAVEGVYLLHFDPPYLAENGKHWAGHYVGFAEDIRRRIAEHRAAGADAGNLPRVAVEAGSRLVLARVWVGLDRTGERRIKNGRRHAKLCPICRAGGGGALVVESAHDPESRRVVNRSDRPGKGDDVFEWRRGTHVRNGVAARAWVLVARTATGAPVIVRVYPDGDDWKVWAGVDTWSIDSPDLGDLDEGKAAGERLARAVCGLAGRIAGNGGGRADLVAALESSVLAAGITPA